MISKIRIMQLPKANWISHSQEKIEQFEQGAAMVEASSPVFVYFKEEPLLVSGLYRPTLVGIPYLWALLARGIEKATLADFRFLRQELETFTPFQTLIERDYVKGDRFARAMGLTPEGRYMNVLGIEHEIYGRSSCHS